MTITRIKLDQDENLNPIYCPHTGKLVHGGLALEGESIADDRSPEVLMKDVPSVLFYFNSELGITYSKLEPSLKLEIEKFCLDHEFEKVEQHLVERFGKLDFIHITAPLGPYGTYEEIIARGNHNPIYKEPL